ncbi:MAG: hypothetical protein ACREAU_06430, partial [Nitrosopumilaceae archaeon]
ILKGGNFVERFRYNSFEATNSIFGELGVWRHDSYPIVRVDNPTKTIFVQTDLTNIFSTAGLVFQVVLSDNNKEWFTVVSSSYNAGTDETAIIVTQVVDETILFNAPLDPILQDFSRDLGVILGIIYDPIVNTTNPLDQVKTLVYTTTSVDATADGIEYTWIGPTHFDIGMNYTDLTGIATIDGFGVSNNLTGQPDSYNLICVNMTTDTFTIRRLDPILGIPVDLTDSFTPGTQFRITDSFNSINNFSLIIPENGPPGTPAQPTPPLLPAIGDYWYDTSTILLFTDITPVPDAQVAVIDILQANNTLEQFIVEGNFTTDFVAGFQFVVSNSGGNNGTYTTSSSVFGAFTPTTTTITVFENVSTNATTGVITRFGSSPATLRQWNGSRWNEVFVFNFPWTVMTATFNPGIDPCTGLIGVTTLEVIEDITDQTPVIGLIPQPYFGRIIREPLIVTERSGNTTATTIQDTLQFNWGQLQRYLIILTDQPNNAFIVNSVDILTNIILTNDRIDVIGTQGNDGEYNVVSVVNTGFNQYTITVQEIIPVQPLLETGVIQLDNLDITNWFQYLITDANATTNIFTLYGNATGDIQNGMEIRVLGTANNNGVYLVTIAPVFNGTHTLVPVNDILVDGQGGFIESVRDYGMRLLFRDTIGVVTTEEATAAVVDTAGSLIGAWDFPYWDTGPFDESIPTVIHLYGNTFSP